MKDRKYWVIGGLLVVIVIVVGFLFMPKDKQNAPVKAVVNTIKAKPSDSDPDAVKKGVISYSNAYLGGHGNDAYNLLSSRCAARITVNEMIGLALAANQAYGNLTPTKITVEILSAGKAVTSYSYPTASSINQQDQSWLYEQGGWRYDGCPA